MNFALSTGYDTGGWLDPNDSQFDSETLVTGSDNTAPVISDTPQSGGFTWGGLHNILGAIGQTARDVGTTVGSIKRAGRDIEGNYKTAEANAASGNKLGQWWQYSSTTDKVMIGIGIAGLYLVIKGHK